MSILSISRRKPSTKGSERPVWGRLEVPARRKPAGMEAQQPAPSAEVSRRRSRIRVADHAIQAKSYRISRSSPRTRFPRPRGPRKPAGCGPADRNMGVDQNHRSLPHSSRERTGETTSPVMRPPYCKEKREKCHPAATCYGYEHRHRLAVSFGDYDQYFPLCLFTTSIRRRQLS